MTTQTEMFPRTTLELLEELAEVHRADQDKAVKAIDALSDDEKIARAYEKAEERLAKARHLVAAIDQAVVRERKRLTGADVAPTVEDAVRDMKRTAEESGTRVTLSAGGKSVTFGAKAVDPITGEVATSTVFALYPGDDDLHETPVGDRTRYGELVADYLTAAGLHDEHAKDWTVVARRELTNGGAGRRNLRDIISPEDYGQELLVVALEQGSVTGAAAEKVAT